MASNDLIRALILAATFLLGLFQFGFLAAPATLKLRKPPSCFFCPLYSATVSLAVKGRDLVSLPSFYLAAGLAPSPRIRSSAVNPAALA